MQKVEFVAGATALGKSALNDTQFKLARMIRKSHVFYEF
jgi:hypothetical protein